MGMWKANRSNNKHVRNSARRARLITALKEAHRKKIHAEAVSTGPIAQAAPTIYRVLLESMETWKDKAAKVPLAQMVVMLAGMGVPLETPMQRTLVPGNAQHISTEGRGQSGQQRYTTRARSATLVFFAQGGRQKYLVRLEHSGTL